MTNPPASEELEAQSGTKCEIRVLEERVRENGEIEVMVKGEFKPSDFDPNARYALVTKKAFDEKGILTKTLLQINSHLLLKVFKNVVGFYPTVATDFDYPFEMEAPFGMLYHYWDELEAYLSTDVDDMTRMHIKLLLEYMKEELDSARRQNESTIRRGFVRYDFLWTLFKPGDLQYMSNHGHPRLVRLDKTFYAESPIQGKYFDVKYSYVDYDGQHFGQAQDTVMMLEKQYFGMGNAARITNLEIFPRRFSEAGNELEVRLRARGLRFLDFKEQRVMRYSGKHEYLKEPPAAWYDPSYRSHYGKWLVREETGRVIVDRKTFAENYEGEQVRILPVPSEGVLGSRYVVLDQHGKLDPILCPPFVNGFSLQQKLWCRFFLDHLTEITWKPKPMDALILPERQKHILTALVTSHAFPTNTREQSELKGKGLVMLLHGSPGSGKTLTAESAAEATHTPLLSITMGELNTDGNEWFEYKLKEFLRLGMVWKAVVLIDEADVFLEHRQSGPGAQAEKNALVAVFLKHLEYFQGIVFLTSNRVDVFDAAVASRIHLALQYNPPTVAMRLQLWTQRLSSLDANELDLDVDEVLDAVCKAEMNGREISNTVNTAVTLARYSGEKLNLEHIVSVVQVWRDFHDNIKRMEEMHKTMPRQDSMVRSFSSS